MNPVACLWPLTTPKFSRSCGICPLERVTWMWEAVLVHISTQLKYNTHN